MTRRIVLLAAILFIPAAAHAQQGGHVSVYSDYPEWWSTDCLIQDLAPGTLELYVVHGDYIEATQVRFVAPMPSCMTGTTFLYDESPYSTTGSSQTGIVVDYGGCIPLPALAVKMVFATSALTECCPYRIFPYPGDISGEIETEDCQNNTLVVVSSTAVVHNGDYWDCICPYNEQPEIIAPDPPDGATGVPTDVQLSWTLIDLDDSDVGSYYVYLDTIPEPAAGEETYDVATVYDPGPMDPDRTYYWKVESLEYYYAPGEGYTSRVTGRSTVWSFTTGDGPVATRVRTWGAIKALYGN